MTVTVAAAPRMHFIDGLRGVAMLAVVLSHAHLYAGLSGLNWHVGTRSIDLLSFLDLGHYGVNLFLLLSGFCLYWPFVKGGARKEPTLAAYAYRRCRRILPPYYVTLMVFGGLGIVQALSHHHFYNRAVDVHFAGEWLATHALMIHNLFPADVLAFDAPLWSLALEFQLYILFPVIVEAYRRWNRLYVLMIVLAVCSLYVASIPIAAYAADPANVFVLRYGLFGRCFEFALGMHVAYIFAVQSRSRGNLLGVADLSFGIAVLLAGILWPDIFQEAAVGIVFAALVLAGARRFSLLGRLLSHWTIVGTGVFSYSVYLIHQPILQGVGSVLSRYRLPTPVVWAIVVAVAIPGVVGIGYLFHLLFEKPFMSLPQKPPANSAAEIPVVGGNVKQSAFAET